MYVKIILYQIRFKKKSFISKNMRAYTHARTYAKKKLFIKQNLLFLKQRY